MQSPNQFISPRRRGTKIHLLKTNLDPRLRGERTVLLAAYRVEFLGSPPARGKDWKLSTPERQNLRRELNAVVIASFLQHSRLVAGNFKFEANKLGAQNR